MPTASKAPARKAPAKKSTAAAKSGTASKKTPAKKTTTAKDATALLKADHQRVADLFEAFESAKSDKNKASIVAQICTELTVHAQIEEEIFYPAVKSALKDHEMVPEATVEHAAVKDLIAEVQGKEPYGEMYDARVKVMGEFVKHHVKEEEKEMFAKVRKTDLDLKALGEQMAARKEELMAAMPSN